MTDIEKQDLNVTEEEGTEEIFTLTDMETGEEQEFVLIDALEHKGNTYYAMCPNVEESDEYVILRAVEENGEITLSSVDDDDEFDEIADLFGDRLFDEVDYDQE